MSSSSLKKKSPGFFYRPRESAGVAVTQGTHPCGIVRPPVRVKPLNPAMQLDGEPVTMSSSAHTVANHAQRIAAIVSSPLVDSPKKLATFVLKLNPKGDANGEDHSNEYHRAIKRKKDKETQTIKLISADPRNSKNPADKMSELKVLQELANVRTPNSGQHNFTEGSIALGKVGNKKAGRLRFRISSGTIFSPSKQQEPRTVDMLSRGEAANTSHDENPLVELDKDFPGKPPEKTSDEPKTGSTAHPEDTDGPPDEVDLYGSNNLDNSSGNDKKVVVFKIFKNMAQQFDVLQDILGEGSGNGSSSFNRTSNRLTLENISTIKGNFTRVRFIRRKVTEKEKKPKARSIEQLVEEEYGDY
ncbi:hypothetical protein GE061_014941 [Apolygus lucorum]|uniref:Uncharacterized protein n=1 Tax=Apolygus lucorum TaxID=248454 RepID=A0A6A4JCD3_APOLU|nr:hypothetical protein GE061_014941 [Apolygus lucorum]